MTTPQNDPEFEQKFFLISFVSSNGKREKGKTFGIKLYGSFETKEEAEKYIAIIKSEEESYFDIFLDQVGKWVSFPDNQEVNAENTIFLNTQSSSDVDINVMYEELNNNFKKKEEFENNIKQVIRTKTLFEKPETDEENKEFLEYLFQGITQKKDDITFFKETIAINLKKLEQSTEEQELDLEKVECEEDFLTSLSTPTTPQKYALISFVDETTPRQKGKTFSVKVRGCFSSVEELNRRKQQIMSFDNSFDLYKVPVGEWIAFKNKEHFEPQAFEDLNKILYSHIQFLISMKKDFELRRNKAKKGEEVEEVVFNKKELETIICRLKEKLSKNSELFTFIFNSTKKYLKYSKEKFGLDFTEEQYKVLQSKGITHINT